ncbi:MAG: hypothetical protein AUG51_20860 [Acidobacteria bacterium 13_1_20CM_3_53_8]|nr:MAG: hypothetical protein AUH05_06575 [Ktedonobacter sp. 13_2_20CM_53_11]OLE51874.1 MAG: hypothetical protein AUG51_20860 [Acidobacteria bacterium 13_1_20CM_3_53_8]
MSSIYHDGSNEQQPTSEITQGRAERIYQAILASLAADNLTEGERAYLELLKAKWQETSLERWRPLS